MNERRSSQIVVDERGGAANSPQSQPADGEFGGVLQVIGHDLARLDTQREKIVAVLTGHVVDLLKGILAFPRPKADRVAMIPDGVFKEIPCAYPIFGDCIGVKTSTVTRW